MTTAHSMSPTELGYASILAAGLGPYLDRHTDAGLDLEAIVASCAAADALQGAVRAALVPTHREQRDARIARCRAVRRRFAGRAEMERGVMRGSASALVGLERNLGLISASDAVLAEVEGDLVEAFGRAREIASSGGSVGAYMRAAAARTAPLSATSRRIRAIQAARLAAKTGRPETNPPRAIDRYAATCAELDLRRAGFREAAHAHTTTVTACRPGELPCGGSRNDTISASSAGMSNAYCRKAYTVAQSEHWLRVDASYLSGPRLSGGALYLTPTMRLVQSRGASLALQTGTPGRGGKLVWR